MDHKSTSTFQALEAFILTQRALLAQAQQDIARLQALKSYISSSSSPSSSSQPAAVDPNDLLDKLNELEVGEIKDPSFYRLQLPDGIDWSAFEGCDPGPLNALALSIQAKQASNSGPLPTQTSPPSELQRIVKESKKTILDPVLAQTPIYSNQIHHGVKRVSTQKQRNGNAIAEFGEEGEDEGEEEEEMDESEREALRMEFEREREQAKIRELKKRKIMHPAKLGGLSLPGFTRNRSSRSTDMGSGPGGLGTEEGVFIRRDVEDESADVDIDLGDDGAHGEEGSWNMGIASEIDGNTWDSAQSNAKPSSSHHEQQLVSSTSRPSRTRRATTKARARTEESSSTTQRKSKNKPERKNSHADVNRNEDTPDGMEMDVDEEYAGSKGSSKLGKAAANRDGTGTGKPKSETYKQAWSVSEQHLLEQLLEQIPDGEKNRWKKISRAMDGRRTPRQVASRVQKYFEKLKRFGIDVNAGIK
ncbi:hypothetical protein AMATHDRAFT_6872 [Amanita thiersii Skay4041]|uniref:Uncharacterized protein n=1 Tax=Amanita thiersii Skay4041 TaxID=703135 RepID=A0A2A9NGD7_9AGAR|nr:hypothetical protein AMATHDRAFT_6872 [Amanita thiersii Skay4041]